MGPGCAQGLRGEAAVIDLGEGKTVFAILANGQQGQNVDWPIWVADEAYRAQVIPLCKTIREPAGGCQI